MIEIFDKEIRELGIRPSECVEWIRESFLLKRRCQLPSKSSLHPKESDFINTMPFLLPEEFHTYRCKIVSRIVGTLPALKSKIIIENTETGSFEAILDGVWITTMRTGAVASLAIQTLKRKNSRIYSFIGLGEKNLFS